MKGKSLSGATLIVAQDHQGHRLVYVRLLAEEILARGGTVCVALTSAGHASKEFTTHLALLAARIRSTTISRLPLSIKAVEHLATTEKCTTVLVPDGDRFAIRLGLAVRSWTPCIVALVMQDPFWSKRPGFVHAAMMRFKAGTLWLAEHRKGCRLLYLSDHDQAPRRPSQKLAPDPVFFDTAHLDPAALRRTLDLEASTYWFVVAGRVSPRKNLPAILQALMLIGNPGAGLFVCGQIESSVKAEVVPLFDLAREKGIAVRVEDRLQTDSELNAAIQASDCVIVAYSSDQPTSMMAKAVRAGRQIVVAGSPSLLNWAGNLNIDLVSSLDVTEMASMFREAMQRDAPAARLDLGHSRFAEAFL